jgi:hypothetical protein
MSSVTTNAKHLATEAAETAADKTKEVLSSAAGRAKDLGKSAAQAVDAATAKVGSGIETAAEKLRDKGPHEGLMGAATSKVADTMERGGRYLEREGLTGMAEDVTATIKRHPVPSLLIALGIGFLIGRALRS